MYRILKIEGNEKCTGFIHKYLMEERNRVKNKGENIMNDNDLAGE